MQRSLCVSAPRGEYSCEGRQAKLSGFCRGGLVRAVSSAAGALRRRVGHDRDQAKC